MPTTLGEEAKALIRRYRMNWDSLVKIKRQDRSLAVGIDSGTGTGSPTFYMFNVNTHAFIGNFTNLEEAEILILSQAAMLYGDVITSEEAVAQYKKLLKLIGAKEG